MGFFNFLKINKNVDFGSVLRNGGNGQTKDFYDNGTGPLFMIMNFKNSKMHGEWIEYFRNGKTRRIIIYENGMKNGPEKAYYENGNLKLEANYINDKKDGTYKTYYNNNNPKEEKKYDEGKLNSIKHWDENGFELKSKIEMNGGFINGKVEIWFKNNSHFIEGIYIDGIEKEQKVYFENGRLQSSVTYKNNKIEKYMKWDENGKIKTNMHYKDGQLISETLE